MCSFWMACKVLCAYGLYGYIYLCACVLCCCYCMSICIDFCVIHMVHDMHIWVCCVYKDFMRVGIWIGVVCVYAGMSMYVVTLIWV